MSLLINITTLRIRSQSWSLFILTTDRAFSKKINVLVTAQLQPGPARPTNIVYLEHIERVAFGDSTGGGRRAGRLLLLLLLLRGCGGQSFHAREQVERARGGRGRGRRAALVVSAARRGRKQRSAAGATGRSSAAGGRNRNRGGDSAGRRDAKPGSFQKRNEILILILITGSRSRMSLSVLASPCACLVALAGARKRRRREQHVSKGGQHSGYDGQSTFRCPRCKSPARGTPRD
jgi:hypothetical protein